MDSATRGRDRAVAAMVIASGVLVAAVRWWTSRRRDVFHLNPDEPGQLAIARFVGGGTRWNMFDHSTWRPGYGTLIAPLRWFADDPVTAFRAALVVNAVLGGVTCVLLYLLARRLTAMTARWCAAAAVAVSLAPALLFTTNWVWSEALVQATYLTCLLCALCFLAMPSIGWGVAMSVAAAAGFGSHSRLLPLSLAASGLIVVSAVRRRLPVASALGLVALMAVLIVAVSRYSRWVVSRIWDDPRPTNTAGGVLGQLREGGSIAVSAVGQAWYQLVTTVGIAGFGTLALIRAAARRRAPERPATDDARLVLVVVGLLVGLSVVFMADRWRPDQVVYGRYNDLAMAPVVLVGVGALVTARQARLAKDVAIVLAVMVAAGVILRVLRDEQLGATGNTPAMVLGLLGFLGAADAIRVAGITLVAAVLLAVVGFTVVATTGRSRQAVVSVALVMLLALGYATTRPLVDRGTNGWDIADGVSSVGDVLPPGTAVRERLVPDDEGPSASWSQQRLRSMLYQFYLPDNPVYRDGERPSDPWTPYVFAPLDDPDLVAARAEVVWRDPGVPIGLWREPASGHVVAER